MPTTVLRCTAGVLAAAFAALAPTPGATAEPPSIAVAASLRHAMPDIVAAFERDTGLRVRTSYAASGKLTRQAQRGAPFELFLAADAAYPQRLVAAGLTRGEPVTYALGRIGLFVPKGSARAADGGLAGLREALDAGALERFAIPNPEHAPYGVRARQALTHAGLWEAIQPLLVLGENAAQTAQFAASGSADGGIVPASLAATPRLQRAGRFAPIPEDRYERLAQQMVLLEGAGATAERFHAFMRGEAARAILREHGFAVPGATR